MWPRAIAPYPGVLDVIQTGPYARLEWGPLAGILRWQALSEWKRDVLLVLAEDLSPARCHELGVRRPAEALGDACPILRAAVERAPAYQIDEALAPALRAAGCRLCRVGYHRGSGELLVELEGPGWRGGRLELCLGSGWQVIGDGVVHGEADEAIDRVLRAATGGRVSEAAVRAAVDIGARIDPLLVDARTRERVASTCAQLEELQRSDPALVEEYGWMFAPEASPYQNEGRERELAARREAGETTRARAEQLAAQLASDEPPARVHVEGVGWIQVERRPAALVRAGARTLQLAPSCWASRRG